LLLQALISACFGIKAWKRLSFAFLALELFTGDATGYSAA
jgi:hypothetical protein